MKLLTPMTFSVYFVSTRMSFCTRPGRWLPAGKLNLGNLRHIVYNLSKIVIFLMLLASIILTRI